MRCKRGLFSWAVAAGVGGLAIGSVQGAPIPVFNAARMIFSHDASNVDTVDPVSGDLPVTANTTAPNYSYNSTVFSGVKNPGAVATNASSLGRIGMGWTSTSTKTAVTWASSMGVSQTDPGPNNDGAATMFVSWDVSWKIPSGSGTFGPPMSTTFNIPIAGTVGTGGSAHFDVKVQWYVFRAGSSTGEFFRTYTDANNWGPGSFFQSFSAPAVAVSPSVFNPGDTIGISGTMNFLADNEFDPDSGLASPVTLGTPYYSTDPEEYPFVPNFNEDPAFGGFVVAEAVPVPTSAKAGLALLSALAICGGIRRRRALASV
jgi:hypothetical protein